MEIYRSGRFKLAFSPAMQRYLKENQRDFMPEDTKAGMIQAYLDKYAIVDWNARREVGSGTEPPTGTWDPQEAASTEQGKIIAYGSLFIDESSTGDRMIDTELELHFYDREAKPSGLYQLVISCSTSAYGDFMTGCKSNVLYIDNFEWAY